VAGIHDNNLIADDEVLVAAPFRMDLDQHVRDGDDAHMRRYRGADADCEVDAINARHVPARQHGLLDPGALLGREVHARAGLCLTLLGLALSGLIPRLVLTRLSLLRLALVALLSRALVALLGLPLVALTLISLALARGLVGLTAAVGLALLALALVALLGLTLLALTLVTLLRLALFALALVTLLGLALFALALFALALVTLLRLTLLALALLLSAALLCRLRLLGLLTPALAALTAGTATGHVLRRSKSYAGHQGGRRQ
jgi:hypothetical protein